MIGLGTIVNTVAVIAGAIARIISPVKINYNGMIIFAVIGVVVNFGAAFFTRGSDSLNQRAVNLHMLEDMLGWLVVLVGAIVMRFTDIALIDPIMSVCVALFIFVSAAKNLKEVLDIFLEKTPHGVSVRQITEIVCEIEEVIDAHHIHVWSMDGCANYATMHIVAKGDPQEIKKSVRYKLGELGIHHVTLELESEGEHCEYHTCRIDHHHEHGHGHHRHHHH